MAWSDPLENAKHEAFAQAVASGKKLSDAYLSVYPSAKRSSAKSGATRLMREIGGRIDWLKQELAKKKRHVARRSHPPPPEYRRQRPIRRR